jgi:hypothetical protein
MAVRNIGTSFSGIDFMHSTRDSLLYLSMVPKLQVPEEFEGCKKGGQPWQKRARANFGMAQRFQISKLRALLSIKMISIRKHGNIQLGSTAKNIGRDLHTLSRLDSERGRWTFSVHYLADSLHHHLQRTVKHPPSRNGCWKSIHHNPGNPYPKSVILRNQRSRLSPPQNFKPNPFPARTKPRSSSRLG